jgi:hypothetical protein
MNYTGHCLDKFTGRPSTAPVANTFRPGTADDAKKDWDRFRFGQQTNNYGDTLGRYSLSNLKTDRSQGIRHTSYNDNPKTHPLIKFENQVLEYRVTYEERVRTEDGSHIEPHDCLLRFFVEDGTLEIIEKPVSNSGRTEFRLVKRATIFKPNSGGKDKYTAADMIPGNRIIAYGMSFQILHGTQLAQSYTTSRFGEPPMTDRPMTADSLDTFGKNLFNGTGGVVSTAGLMSTRKERISSFLTQQDFSQQIDNICLDLVWDDSNALYGDVHFLKLKYYLLDDTADVFCIDARKFETKYSGSRAIVKRQKLQKETELSAPLQGLDSRMRLSSGSSQRHQAPKQQYIDCNAPGTFYHWSELLPGTSVVILGRQANVVGFGNTRTEKFYTKMMGNDVVDELKDKYRLKYMGGEIPNYKHEIPEHSGIGSYEDSMRSVKAIAPEAPPSGSSNSKALRFKLQFKARLLSNIASDQTRTFIVSYFCEDGTMMVFEASPRNSGRSSYTFAGRSKYVRIFDANNGNEPIYYGAKDIYVGAILVINGHHLELEEAAAGTNKFLEEFSGQFD